MLRPPLSVERLERLPGGRLAYRMKTPWRDGTTHVIISDSELVEKLAALVPAPRFHLVRYFGILASAAKQGPSIVPVPPPASRVQSCGHRDTAEKENSRPRNYTWAQLMARIKVAAPHHIRWRPRSCSTTRTRTAPVDTGKAARQQHLLHGR